MRELFDAPEPSQGNETEFADLRDLRERAATAQREGLRALEAGDLDSATGFLVEAVAAYEQLGDVGNTNSVAHYLGVALAEQGQSFRALRVWEEIIARGWDSPAAFTCLIRHYESQGDDEQVQSLYKRLQQAAVEKTGEFFRFSPQPVPSDPEASAEDAGAGADHLPRVLIADDEPITCAVLERILAPLDHEVVVVTNGKDALNVIMSSHLDLILLDVFMPLHTGLDILYRMRAQAIQTPVIVMSGYGGGTVVQDACKLGAAFLRKPFVPEAVIDVVTRLIGDSRNTDDDTPPATN